MGELLRMGDRHQSDSAILMDFFLATVHRQLCNIIMNQALGLECFGLNNFAVNISLVDEKLLF